VLTQRLFQIFQSAEAEEQLLATPGGCGKLARAIRTAECMLDSALIVRVKRDLVNVPWMCTECSLDFECSLNVP
jgi:hypothetical protein